ncbi:DUF4037 domain-containing protein [Kribbella sp. CA-293567]|uniref:DUF4037 domain-containing protein n=1 Tax=Kribbella sp. CA-293567 TaxID=3002436 RepID=UPI0022DDFA9E|nr:DUF4037 domain-containing protein [Kribbella sp. CA-293567]WBQ02604.1 DUF4037 domain-containing protein [Kribbella sp. CA-293567]
MTPDGAFVPATTLSHGFHDEVIRPLLPEIPYAAALVGWGSDVLGYDTERSTDHDWGPRLHVFVDAHEVDRVTELIEPALPKQYKGHPVQYGSDTVTPVHRITVTTVDGWLEEHLGVHNGRHLSLEDWLVTPQQKLLGVVAGAVYADDGRLQVVRDALRWYPDDPWLWMLACQWSRVAQEEPFVQRTSEVGDELGSRIVAARLVRDLMRLALLMERAYAPYTKWLGTAFARLGHPDGLDRDLDQALAAHALPQREHALTTAYEKVARRHNALALTAPVDPSPRPFHDRPALILDAGRFEQACLDRVSDQRLKDLGLIGTIDQFADNTDVLSNPAAYRRLISIYQK